MSDTSVVPERGASIPQLDQHVQFPFYQGISGNRLYFHKAPREKLEGILHDGLSQPPNGGNVLSRRLSYSSDKRYSEGSGYILGFKPAPGEIPDIPPQFAREVSISKTLSVLPPERNIFNLPGVSRLPWQLFEAVTHIIDDYYAAKFNVDMLGNSLTDLLVVVKERMLADAQLNNPNDLHMLSQEIVWNEFCSATTRIFDSLSFHTGQIMDIRSRNQSMTYDDLQQRMRSETVVEEFDRDAFANDVRFLSSINTIEGLGFEGHPYPIDERMHDAVSWVKELPMELPPSQTGGQGGFTGFLKKVGISIKIK